MSDKIADQILKIIESANEPLETLEIVDKVGKVSRAVVIYRLNNLRGDGKIKGKSIGAGKGNWIWWRSNAFKP